MELVRDALQLLLRQRSLLTAVGIFSAAAFAGTLAAIPVLIVRLPHDYFLREPVPARERRRPWLVRGRRILKNVAGLLLLPAGIVMLVLPGQGLLTILISVALIDFPGKRRAQMSLLSRAEVYRAAARLRRRYGKRPLELPRRAPAELRWKRPRGRSVRPEEGGNA